MKTKIKRFSKSSISVILALCMMLSVVSIGIVSVNAVSASGYYLIGGLAGGTWGSNKNYPISDKDGSNYYIDVTVPSHTDPIYFAFLKESDNQQYGPGTGGSTLSGTASSFGKNGGNSWKYDGSASKLRIYVNPTASTAWMEELGSTDNKNSSYYLFIGENTSVSSLGDSNRHAMTTSDNENYSYTYTFGSTNKATFTIGTNQTNASGNVAWTTDDQEKVVYTSVTPNVTATVSAAAYPNDDIIKYITPKNNSGWRYAETAAVTKGTQVRFTYNKTSGNVTMEVTKNGAEIEEPVNVKTYKVILKDSTRNYRSALLDGEAESYIIGGYTSLEGSDGRVGDWSSQGTTQTGMTLQVKTKIKESYRNKYFVRGFCVNGKTYGLNKKLNSNGEYTADITIDTELPIATGSETPGFDIEITPIMQYFIAGGSNGEFNSNGYVTFTVEGFTQAIQDAGWGNTLAVYAWYKDNLSPNNVTMLGGYPGIPLIYEGGKHYIEIPKTIDGKDVIGVTLNNFWMDDIHHNSIHNVTDHHQSYDFDDFVKIVTEHDGTVSGDIARNIIFTMHNESTEDNFGFTRIYGDKGTDLSDTYTDSMFQPFTDYSGERNLDVFGNEVTKTYPKVRIVSNGYVQTYQGEYGTEWVVYVKENASSSYKMKAVIPPSELTLKSWDSSSKYPENSYANQLSAYETDYKYLSENVRRCPVEIYYEKAIKDGNSINNDYNKYEEATRMDGRWNFTTDLDKVKSSIQAKYTMDNGSTWTDISLNADGTSDEGVQAFFTNTDLGNTTPCINSGDVPIDLSKTFDFKAIGTTNYQFLGWERLKSGITSDLSTTKQSDGSYTASSSRSSSDIYIAKFKYIDKGTLTLTHTASPAAGASSAVMDVTVKDTNDDTVFSASGVTTAAIGSSAITSETGDYTVSVTLKTTPASNYEFDDFSINNASTLITAAKFMGGTSNTSDTVKTRTFTFKVSELYKNAAGTAQPKQQVKEINYLSTLENADVNYVINYSFPTRKNANWGTQVMKVEGKLTDAEKADTSLFNDTTKKVTAKFLENKKPHESNFKEELTFDWDTAVSGQSFNEATNTLTVNVVATSSDKYKITGTFKLPYTYDTNGVAVQNENGEVVKGDSATLTISATYKEHFKVNDKFLTAPEYILDGSAKKYFQYWKILAKEGDTEEIARCYAREFNYTAYQNMYVVLIMEGGAQGANKTAYDNDNGGLGANAQFYGVTRNQWNIDNSASGGTAPASLKDAADRLFVDFKLSYNYNGNDLNQYSNGVVIGKKLKDNVDADDADAVADPTNWEDVVVTGADNVKVGIAFERLGELNTKADGKKDTDNFTGVAGYNAATDNLETFIKNGTDTTTTGVEKRINKVIAVNNGQAGKSITTQLDNKGMVQYGYAFANDAVNKDHLFRAYSYIIINGTTIKLSQPIYFTLYDVASAKN